MLIDFPYSLAGSVVESVVVSSAFAIGMCNQAVVVVFVCCLRVMNGIDWVVIAFCRGSLPVILREEFVRLAVLGVRIDLIVRIGGITVVGFSIAKERGRIGTLGVIWIAPQLK